MTRFVAAAVQMQSGLDVGKNVDHAEQMIRDAASAGATYVLTPEMTTVLDLNRKRLMAAIATEAADPSLKRFRALAGELGIHLHVGSMAVKLSDDAVANRSFLIDPNGTILARYDKIHMFDVDLAGGESYRESKLYRPGDEAVVADLPWTRLGLTICYDLRFAYLYRALAQAGAAVIALPAAFTKTTGEAHWHVLVRARAIETGSFVIAAAQGGTHADDRETFGHSMIVDPWGKIVAEAERKPGFIIAEVDPEMSATTRGRIASLSHDRSFQLPGERAKLETVS